MGVDLYGKPMLAELLIELGKVDVPWIRIHYAYPTGLTPAVLAAIKDTLTFCPISIYHYNILTPKSYGQ